MLHYCYIHNRERVVNNSSLMRLQTLTKPLFLLLPNDPLEICLKEYIISLFLDIPYPFILVKVS